MIEIIFYFIVVLVLNFLFIKINFIPNYSGQTHQLFTSQNKIQLSGGFFVYLLFLFIFKENLQFLILSFFIFLIGFAGDKNYLSSPKARLILQIIFVLSFVYILNLTISSSRVDLVDQLLENNIFSYFFITFCILVLINGSNFIDGLNGLLIGYFIIVIFIINKLGLLIGIGLNNNEIIFLFSCLGFLLILNYLNVFFLGDGGSYLLGIIMSFILISIYNLNQFSLSPYFIIFLLWYPCFENLFSIIRKNRKKFSPIHADNKHLHQLIFLNLKQKINLKINFLNSLSSILINLYNLVILFIASLKPDHTIYQIVCLLFSISIYLLLYLLLSKNIKLASNKK